MKRLAFILFAVTGNDLGLRRIGECANGGQHFA